MNDNDKKTTERDKALGDFLAEHARTGAVSFHMPGHKGAGFYEKNGFGAEMKRLADWDITEIAGADNLFQPETVIRRTMQKYERLYQTRRSYLLINGSSAGIIAAILAAVPRGGRLLMARNCHKSVFNALYLGDIQPLYLHPQTDERYGVAGEVRASDVAALLEREPQAAAVILASPNYYGICSDIAAIARVTHERGRLLIVDQAHGAHLKFFEEQQQSAADSAPGEALRFPPAAESLGADLVINSTHKTLASFTQTAVLNVCSERIDLSLLEDRLQMVESSSPSYPLMATLDINADILAAHKDRLMEEWSRNLSWFYGRAERIAGLALMKGRLMDPSKINLDMSACGLDGDRLEQELMSAGIFPELVSGDIVMCMTGIGNTRSDYERLAAALAALSERYGQRYGQADANDAAGRKAENGSVSGKLSFRGLPQSREKIALSQAAGRVCAMSLIPYPPGIPLACPGEELDAETVAALLSLRRSGRKVIGVDEDMSVWVEK